MAATATRSRAAGWAGTGGGGGFFFASKDEAKELFAVKKFEPKTAGEGEDQGVDAPTEAAAKVEADNPAESASEEEGNQEIEDVNKLYTPYLYQIFSFTTNSTSSIL